MRLPTPAPRAAVVLPLPPPSVSDQSDSDECGRSSSDESDVSDESEHSSSDESYAQQQHEQRFVRYHRASSASSSSISSALSFSRTSSDNSANNSDDDDNWSSDANEHALLNNSSDTDPEALFDRSARRRTRSSNYVPLQTSSRREITMAAIRNAETLGFVALLIPLTGIATMVTTEALACTYHFDCARNYPTLSYAATFKPEGLAFMVGMCLTALFILLSSLLYYWFLRLRLGLSSGSSSSVDAQTQYTALTCAVAGVATAVTLAGLAIYDMRSHHDAHIAFTVVFFIASWILIVFCHLARRLVLGRDSGLAGGAAPALRLPSASTALLHWRRLSIPMAFTLGRLFILAGITSTALCTSALV